MTKTELKNFLDTNELNKGKKGGGQRSRFSKEIFWDKENAKFFQFKNFSARAEIPLLGWELKGCNDFE